MIRLFTTGSTGTIGKHLPNNVYRLKLDLSSNQKNFKDVDFAIESNLIHLAGVVGEPEVLKDIDYARAVNIHGTEFLAKEFIKKSEGIFYYISTSHVYAPSLQLISESHALAPLNIYAEQKLEAELLLQSMFEYSPKRLCIIRVFSVLDWDVPSISLGGAIRKLTDVNSNFVLCNSSDIRDFMAPKDIASALFKISSTSTHFEVVNLCTSFGISVGAAAKKMLSESGFEVAENRFSWGQSSNPSVVGDNSLLKARHPTLILSWQPSNLNGI